MSTHRTSRTAALGLTVGALVAGSLAFAPAASAAPSTTVVINEVYGAGGNSGAVFTHDFIELKNIGTAPISVTGWSVQYASATGSTWTNSTTLTGTIAPGGTYLVTEAGSGPAPSNANSSGSIAMAAGAGKVALVNNAAPLTCATACAGTTAVVDFVGYGTTANNWEGAGRTPAPSAQLSVSRNAAGADTDNNNLDFTPGAPSPESAGVSADPPTRNCPEGETAPIGTVQGEGPASPCVGETVTVAGTVVGDVQDGLRGFYLQDAGDGNAATSDGIFVFSSYPVVQGERVVVEGTVTEYEGLTELTSAFVTRDGSGTLPAATPLPLPSSDAQREALEGMLVAPSTPLTVSEVFNLDRYGELLLSSGGRLVTPTEAAEPGPGAAAVAAENARRSIVLDDGVSTRLDTSEPPLAPPYLTLEDPVRVGDTAVLEPVVLTYGFGAWRLQPADGTAAGMVFEATNPRPAAPAPVGGDLRIADFNVLNYFVDFPSEFGDDARGAENAEELAEQQAKIVSALIALDADVITLHEIENSAVLTPETPYRALETLVNALNDAQGPNTWRYVEAHEASDVITNAIIYRNNAAHPVGAPMKPAEDTVWDNAREPIAQTFKSRGEVFTVIANHLKSKGATAATGANRDLGDGQGAYNQARVEQATALVAFAQQVVATVGDPDVVLTGDFNAYRNEDPLDVIRTAGFTEVFTPGEFSYVFSGGSGSLDHVFASPSMLPKITGHTIWDINATESFAYEYDAPYEGLYAPYPYRASDHNPSVIGVDTKAGTPAAGKGRR